MLTYQKNPSSQAGKEVETKPAQKPAQSPHAPAWASQPLQTQLTVNQPGDAYEVEADQLADQVMRMPEAQVQRCACGGDPGPDGECAACRARRLAVQRKSARPGQTAGGAPISVHHTLNHGGQPLESSTRQSMESRFGTDFSDVRVHTDSQAAQSAQDINARAYTVGSDVVFGPGQYTPGTSAGDRLIAHELVHTMQQGNGLRKQIQRAEALSTQQTLTPTTIETLNDNELKWEIIAVEQQIASLGDGADELLREAALGNRSLLWQEAKARFGDNAPYVVGAAALGSAKGTKIEKPGLIAREEWNIRALPVPSMNEFKRLQWEDQVYVLYSLKRPQDPQSWYYVASMTGDRGWMRSDGIALNPPDPKAELYRVKPGENTYILVSRWYEPEEGWGRWWLPEAWGGQSADEVGDARFYVSALAYANRDREGVKSPKDLNDDDAWRSVQILENHVIWKPGKDFLKTLKGKVSSGSKWKDAWETVKKAAGAVVYWIAFQIGMVYGALESVYDLFAGVVDLIEVIVKVIKSLADGTFLDDARQLWEDIKKIDIAKILGEFADKWTADDPWDRGFFQGRVIGYIAAEILMAIFSVGVLTAIKWTGRFAKVSKALAKLGKLSGKMSNSARKFSSKIGNKAGKAKGHLKDKFDAPSGSKAGVPGSVTKLSTEAYQWAKTTLKIGDDILSDLTEAGVRKLRQLSDAVLERISRLSNRAKRWLLGCASECDVDLEKIKKTLDDLTDEEIEAALEPLSPKKKGPDTPEPKSDKGPKKIPFKPIPVEDVVQEAITLLKKRGIKGLPPAQYGTKLHAAVHEIVLKRTGKAPKGWIAASEQELGKIVKLRPENASLTVREYMTKWGMTDRYPKLPDKFLDTEISKLKPDLFVQAPNGRALVWDVTSQYNPQHLAKTMFYTEVIGRELGGFFRIAESYWRKISIDPD